MSHGFYETRTVKMEPGPDGKPVPHVYIERRPLSEKEAAEIMKDQAQIFSGFDELFSGMNGMFSNMDGFFASFDGVFKTMDKKIQSFMKKHGQGDVERRD